MAIITYKMPMLNIEVETDLEKYLPEGEITLENVNTKSMRIILEEAIEKALNQKTTRKKIGDFLSSSIFSDVKCKNFNFGHILLNTVFEIPLKLKI